VRRENPDVLILLEVTKGWVKPLEKLNRKYPFKWVRPGDVFAGIAVYSKYMPVESRVFDLAGAGTSSFLVTVELGDGDTKQRLSILGTHLKSPTRPLHHQQRNHQLTELARVAREHPWPLLVVGDLNVTQFSPVFGRTVRDSGLTPCTGQALQPTWPAMLPPLFITIDHCLAAPSLRTWDFKVGPDVGSDHFPISVKVQPVR
jgi:endonuclease/exonuclease/phosphatase (EEP) superfamily protein YafD